MKILSLFLLLLTLSGCISTMNLSKEDRATTSNSAFVGWSPTAQDRDKSLFIFEIDGKKVVSIILCTFSLVVAPVATQAAEKAAS